MTETQFELAQRKQDFCFCHQTGKSKVVRGWASGMTRARGTLTHLGVFLPLSLPFPSLSSPTCLILSITCQLLLYLFHTAENIAPRPTCSYFITSLPYKDCPSLSSNLKLPMKVLFGPSWILLSTQGYFLFGVPIQNGWGSIQQNWVFSLWRGRVLRRYIAIGLFFGVVSKKKIVCVNTLHCVSIYLALFQETLFLPATSFSFLSRVK